MTPFCLLAFTHNFRPQSGAKKMGDDFMGEGGLFAHRPKCSPLIFAQLMGEYKRLRLSHDREFYLGRG